MPIRCTQDDNANACGISCDMGFGANDQSPRMQNLLLSGLWIGLGCKEGKQGALGEYGKAVGRAWC